MRRLLGPVIAAALSLASAFAGAAALSAQDQADVARAEAYLNGITTLKARFLQINQDGRTVPGTFYLQRPGKMRIDYDPPVKDFIVADGRFVYFWDAELKQQSNAPIGSTLADVILRDRLSLSHDVTVTGVARDAGTLEITLVQSKDPGQGQLTLVFEDNPLRLRKWRVVDAQGLTTEVALMDPQPGVKLDGDLFYFRDPSRRKERD
jgi:outer membrane lipoprotein-sorting protein